MNLDKLVQSSIAKIRQVAQGFTQAPVVHNPLQTVTNTFTAPNSRFNIGEQIKALPDFNRQVVRPQVQNTLNTLGNQPLIPALRNTPIKSPTIGQVVKPVVNYINEQSRQNAMGLDVILHPNLNVENLRKHTKDPKLLAQLDTYQPRQYTPEQIEAAKNFSLGVAGSVQGLAGANISSKLQPNQIQSIADRFANKFTKEDVNIIGRWAAKVEQTGGKGNLGEDGKTIASLAKSVFGKDAETWSNVKLKNAFDLVLGKIGGRPNAAGLGLGSQSIREGVNVAKGRFYDADLEHKANVLMDKAIVIDKKLDKLASENMNPDGTWRAVSKARRTQIDIQRDILAKEKEKLVSELNKIDNLLQQEPQSSQISQQLSSKVGLGKTLSREAKSIQSQQIPTKLGNTQDYLQNRSQGIIPKNVAQPPQQGGRLYDVNSRQELFNDVSTIQSKIRKLQSEATQVKGGIKFSPAQQKQFKVLAGEFDAKVKQLEEIDRLHNQSIGAGMTPEQAKANFQQKWQEAYGNRPTTVKTLTELDKTNFTKHGKIPEGFTRDQMVQATNVAQPPLGDVKVSQTGKAALQAEKSLSPAERTQAHIQEYQAAKTSAAPPAGGASGGNTGSSLDKGSSKMAYNINKNNLQLSKADKEVLDTTINAVKPELEKAKGKTLTNDEVVKAAKTSDILQKVTTREETEAANAAMLKARQRMVELDKSVTESIKNGDTKAATAQMRDLIDSLRVVSSNAADAGRRLQSLSIEATDESLRAQLIKDITKTGASTDDILNAANKVNWENANSVAEFYRKFIKSTVPEILDEYRYNNMLSSPKTHIRNAFSNALQTFVTRPTTLLVEGKPVEAAKYFGGALKSFPEAVKAFGDAFSGKTVLEKPDLNRISTTKLPRFLTIPTRAMEAGDKFFTALIQGGELARGATAEQASKTAEYSLFRQGLHPEGQGKVLNAIDDMTAWTYKAPKAIRWFVPFIRTPMNFAKQWIEYSPAGLSTIPGAANKREQLAKAIIGSTVTTFGAALAMQGRTTWAAPTDSKEKDYFYASGRKPFSIKIGDTWVPMQYAGPFALALAIPAAMKYYQEDNRTAPTDSGLDKAVKTTAAMAQFFSQQTWLSGLGNFVNWASGDQDYSLPSSLGFTAQQIIPMEALIGYANSIIDPVYRKSNSFTGSIQKNIPGLSQGLEPYTQPTGEPSVRNPLNYALPYDVGRAQNNGAQYEQFYQGRQDQLQQNAVLNDLKKKLESGKTPKNGEQATYTIGGVEYQGFTSGDKFVGMDADGNQVTKSIKDIEKAQRSENKGVFDAEFSLQTDRLKRAGDYVALNKLNQTKLEYYKEYQKTLDPVKDKKEWTTIQNTIEDLEYSLKGGKGKKFKTAKFVPIKTPKAQTIKLSNGKSLTVPKMNIPKMTFATQFTPQGVVPNVPVFKNKVTTKIRLSGGGRRLTGTQLAQRPR